MLKCLETFKVEKLLTLSVTFNCCLQLLPIYVTHLLIKHHEITLRIVSFEEVSWEVSQMLTFILCQKSFSPSLLLFDMEIVCRILPQSCGEWGTCEERPVLQRDREKGKRCSRPVFRKLCQTKDHFVFFCFCFCLFGFFSGTTCQLIDNWWVCSWCRF